MLVALPTLDERGLTARISPHFSRAPWFTLYDTDDESLRTITNFTLLEECSEADCGNPAAQLAAEGVVLVLCANLGVSALYRLAIEGIEALARAGGTVSKVLEAWREDRLLVPTEANCCSFAARTAGRGV